jgi:hypothetical protein
VRADRLARVEVRVVEELGAVLVRNTVGAIMEALANGAHRAQRISRDVRRRGPADVDFDGRDTRTEDVSDRVFGVRARARAWSMAVFLTAASWTGACSFALEGYTAGDPDAGGGDAGPRNADTGIEDAGREDASLDGGDYAAVVLSDNPIAYFRLDERTGDAVNLGSTGVAGTYGSAVVRGVSGLIQSASNAAISFPGDSNKNTLITVAPNVKLQPADEVSVECWVRALPWRDMRLVSYGDDLNAPFEAWVLQSLDGKVSFYLGNPGALLDGTTTMLSNTTYHVVGTYDGHALRVYVNGEPDGTAAATGQVGPYDGVNGLGIGGGFTASPPSLSGVLDEVAVYSYALTADRVRAHYLAGR